MIGHQAEGPAQGPSVTNDRSPSPRIGSCAGAATHLGTTGRDHSNPSVNLAGRPACLPLPRLLLLASAPARPTLALRSARFTLALLLALLTPLEHPAERPGRGGADALDC